MKDSLRLLVYPRDPNPYQEWLYEELERLGVKRRYVGELTGSHTLSLLLLPLELVALRLRGSRCLHLHWVFGFTVPGATRFPRLRVLLRWYFAAVLSLCRRLGIGVVWTAHNVLPHRPVFDDDYAARRKLTANVSAVIAHSSSTLAALEAIGCVLPETAVIPPGAPKVAVDPKAYSDAVHGDDHTGAAGSEGLLRAVFIGKVERHKGLEDLLQVLSSDDDPPSVSLLVAGECRDDSLTESLRQLAARCSVPVELRLWHQSDDELAKILSSGDFAVFPFRSVTSSSSVLMALAAGCPVVVPNLGELNEIPRTCAWHYEASKSALAVALRDAAGAARERRDEMSAEALRFARRSTWADAARATLPILQRVARLEPVNCSDSTATETALVSFIVVNWHEDVATRLCIESIRSTAGDVPIEIIVVDNGRVPDPHRGVQFGDDVIVVRNARNRGFAGGVNDGLRRASGVFVAVVNNDCRLSKGWLAAGMAALEDPGIGLVGGPEVCEDEEHEAADGATSRRTTVTVDTKRGFTVLGGNDVDRAMAVGSLNGSNLLARRDVFARLGGFEERFFTYYEDADLCARALALGYTLLYEPDMVIWHRGGLSSRRRPWRAAYLARRNHLLFVARNFPRTAWRYAFLRSCVQYLAEGIVGTRSGLRGATNPADRLDRTERSAGLAAVAWVLASWPQMLRSRYRLLRNGQHDDGYLQNIDALQHISVAGTPR